MYEFTRGSYQDFCVEGMRYKYSPYYVHVDDVCDFGELFLDSLREKVNIIAYDIAHKNYDNYFGFDKCRKVILAMSDENNDASFVAFDDESAVGNMLSSLSHVERHRALDFALPRLDGRAQLNHRLVCQFFIEYAAHDELVRRGMDDVEAWDKANGFFDKMAHDELERHTYRVDDRLKYDKIWDVFFCVKCAVEVLG